MRKSTDTLGRQWDLLRTIPREPRAVTAAEIKRRLQEYGYDVDIRTIQRDLTMLEAQFPLICSVQGRTNHWSWDRHQPSLEVPRLEAPTAITLLVVRDYLLPLLPKSIGDELTPYFDKAKEVLKGTKLAHWRRRVRMIRRGPLLQVPPVQPELRDAVYRALLDGMQVEADYRGRDAEEPKRLRFHPLGLVVKDDVLYLVATVFAYDDVRHLALHRMSNAVVLEQRTKVPRGFDLKMYIEEGRFAYPIGEDEIELVAVFTEGAAAHLYERQLSADQSLESIEDGTLLKATVSDSSELRWWLLGFGDRVEVLEPRNLREELRATTEAMFNNYQTDEHRDRMDSV